MNTLWTKHKTHASVAKKLSAFNNKRNYNAAMNSIHDIKRIAKEHGITMKAVCDRAQIQQPQVSRWLSGAVDPMWSSVNQLEQALFKLIEEKQSPV